MTDVDTQGNWKKDVKEIISKLYDVGHRRGTGDGWRGVQREHTKITVAFMCQPLHASLCFFLIKVNQKLTYGKLSALKK